MSRSISDWAISSGCNFLLWKKSLALSTEYEIIECENTNVRPFVLRSFVAYHLEKAHAALPYQVGCTHTRNLQLVCAFRSWAAPFEVFRAKAPRDRSILECRRNLSVVPTGWLADNCLHGIIFLLIHSEMEEELKCSDLIFLFKLSLFHVTELPFILKRSFPLFLVSASLL